MKPNDSCTIHGTDQTPHPEGMADDNQSDCRCKFCHESWLPLKVTGSSNHVSTLTSQNVEPTDDFDKSGLSMDTATKVAYYYGQVSNVYADVHELSRCSGLNAQEGESIKGIDTKICCLLNSLLKQAKEDANNILLLSMLITSFEPLARKFLNFALKSKALWTAESKKMQEASENDGSKEHITVNCRVALHAVFYTIITGLTECTTLLKPTSQLPERGRESVPHGSETNALVAIEALNVIDEYLAPYQRLYEEIEGSILKSVRREILRICTSLQPAKRSSIVTAWRTTSAIDAGEMVRRILSQVLTPISTCLAEPPSVPSTSLFPQIFHCCLEVAIDQVLTTNEKMNEVFAIQCDRGFDEIKMWAVDTETAYNAKLPVDVYDQSVAKSSVSEEAPTNQAKLLNVFTSYPELYANTSLSSLKMDLSSCSAFDRLADALQHWLTSAKLQPMTKTGARQKMLGHFPGLGSSFRSSFRVLKPKAANRVAVSSLPTSTPEEKSYLETK